MKPPGIFLFYVSVLLVLSGICWIFPEEGIPMGEDLALNFPTLNSFLEEDTTEVKKVEEILDQLEEGRAETIQISPDSFMTEAEFIAYLEDSIYHSRLKIQYPEGNKSVLYPMFAEWENAWSYDRPIRILHYGDSQLEGDRISSLVRAQLQEKFGGSGPGLIPAYQTVPSFSIWQDNSDNWIRHSSFGIRGGKINHRRYGVLANFTRFTPAPDTTQPPGEIVESWLRLHKSKVAYRKSQSYKHLKLFYGNNTRPVLTKMLADGQFLGIDTLYAGDGLRTKVWDFQKAPEELTLFFRGRDSPEFYAISLEDDHGIMVDNIALRGGSGTNFTSMDATLLKKTYDELNVKAFFLQFGGNAIPYLDSLPEVEEYRKAFKRQIDFLKRLVPGATVIVIGPADMSVKEKTEFVTAPFVEEVRDAVKSAAFESGAAFYDMYEVMGGKNSMPAWVEATPSLAGPDYIHFTPRGAKKIAELFMASLMEDYEEYKINKQTAAK